MQIKTNPYICECDSSTFTVLFNRYNKNNKIKLIHSLLQYPEWKPNIDLFKYVVDINKVRNDPNTYFVFDASTEGFSPFANFFFHILYANCSQYQIDPRKIIFVSTNMKDEKNIKLYNKKNKIKNSIRVFSFLSFRKMILDMVEDTYGLDFDSDKAFEYYKKSVKNSYSEKYGLSLSRVNREHRIMANFLLFENGLSEKFHISQDKVDNQLAKYTEELYHLDKTAFEKWLDCLPLTIDTSDFDTNHALKLNSHLHNSTLFQIVNETHVKDWNRESLFYSEKTFRSIAHMQPFVIFGQAGCNEKLEEYGFKLFRDQFDYSFDSVEDPKKRYLKLLETISNTSKDLDNMNKDEQIEWRFSQEKVLKHNFDCLMNIDFEKEKFIKFVELL